MFQRSVRANANSSPTVHLFLFQHDGTTNIRCCDPTTVYFNSAAVFKPLKETCTEAQRARQSLVYVTYN